MAQGELNSKAIGSEVEKNKNGKDPFRSSGMSKRSLALFFLDLVALCVCLHGLYGTTSLTLPPHLKPAGQFQFLTNLSLLLTCVVLFLDLLLPFQVPSVLLVTVFNLELVVCTAYWNLLFFFSHFLNAGSFEVLLLLDLEIHLFPYVALAIATAKRRRGAKVSFVVSTASTFLALACYFSYIEYMAAFYKVRYPYPFLNGITFPARAAWMAGFGLVAGSNYWIQRLL